MKTIMEVMFGSRKLERRKNPRLSWRREHGSMGHIPFRKGKVT